MAAAPYCNVTVATPQAKPVGPKGIQVIPAGAKLPDIIRIVNNNFNQLIKGNYVENVAARRRQIVRVYDPSDHNSFVDVTQITAVQFINTTTGQTIVWAR